MFNITGTLAPPWGLNSSFEDHEWGVAKSLKYSPFLQIFKVIKITI